MSEIAPYRPHSAEIAPVMSAPQALIDWARSAYVAKRVPWIGERIGEPIDIAQYQTEGVTP